MRDKTFNVLFICTGNSARSVMAEGLMNELGKGRFIAFSAGSHPKGSVHPLALKTLATHRIPSDGAFLDAFVTMKRRIELMLALPLASLDRMAIQKEIKDIGGR